MKLSTLLLEAILVGGAIVQVQAFTPSSTHTFTNTIGTTSKSHPNNTPLDSYASERVTKHHDQHQHPPHLFRSHHHSSSQLFMGWGPDPIWKTATVTSNSAACPSRESVCISLDVPSDVMEGYLIPGQYIQLKPSVEDEDSKPIFLAIASPPPTTTDEDDKNNKKNNDDDDDDYDDSSSTTMEFLIKKTDTNTWITSATELTPVAISQVMGTGFSITTDFDGFKYDFPCQNILLFANGSGIAPIRAAIESGQLTIASAAAKNGTGGGRSCRLYYGVTSPSDMPYADRFARWEEAGVAVVPVISRPEECKLEWPGRTGYVQSVLEEDGVAIPRNSGALVCGVKGMAECVGDLLRKSGVLEGRILTNF